MIVAIAALQTDPAVVQQLEHLVTTQTVIAVALGLMGLSALAVAIGALLAVRKTLGMLNRTVAQLQPRIDPLIGSATRIAAQAEDMSGTVKVRLSDLLDTVDDVNLRLRAGVESVEQRVRQFGAVVDVVQGEAEELLLDAASTARGVHTAAELLRSGGAAAREPLEPYDEDEDS